MSSSWAKTQTTHGHGIFSQHRAEHWKEWVSKETRNQERSASPERVFNDQSSFHRSSLFVPIASEPTENQHHAATKSLAELRQYQTMSVSDRHDTQFPREPSKVTEQPVSQKHLPHMAHHHHFGWNPPTPQARTAVFDQKSKGNFYKMGDAQRYNNEIYSKASVMISKKV